MNTKLNKVFLTELEKLTEREFDVQDTMNLLILTNPSIFMSWGIRKGIGLFDKALLLYVNRNWILITLAWNDTYTVRAFEDIRKVEHHLTEIYFEELQERVNDLINKF
jgi:hypothetical protein